MEKTIFLFRRKAGRSRDEFGRYYVERHAPLGARLTRCLLGYTVNIVRSEGGYDAVTEHWLERASDILTPEIAYATREDFEAVLADDRTLFDGFDLLVATSESVVIDAPPLPAGAPGEATGEDKLIWLVPQGAEPPAPPANARRVVDSHVDHRLQVSATGMERAAADIARVRMAWGPGLATTGAGAATGAMTVAEHRFIPAPAPGWRGPPD